MDHEPATVEERRDAIEYFITKLGISRPEDVANPDSASSRAISWLAEFDPAVLTLDATPQLVLVLAERFAVAALYFLAHNDLLPSNVEVIPAVPIVSVGRHRRDQEVSTSSFGDWMSEVSYVNGRVWRAVQQESGSLRSTKRKLASLERCRPNWQFSTSSSKVTPPVTEIAFVVGPSEPQTQRGRSAVA